jgi:ankyrin repeat protein
MDESRCTPLHWAAQNGREVVAKLLLEKGTDIAAIDKWQDTPLHRAAQNGHEAVTELLLSKEQILVL